MNHLKFSVDSALLRELGEKLVETVHLALVELVKNAYDADACNVNIIFNKDENNNTQIIVSDDGTGMNFQSIEKYWMRIATTNKKDAKYSKVYGRPLSGAKGIGRFSCRRLGKHLKIVTHGTPTGNLLGLQDIIEKTEVEFPWETFLPGEDITNIKCPGYQTTIFNQSTGTNLIISEVPDEWTIRGYNWLKRQLAVLTANQGKRRRGYQEDPGFNVKIFAPDFEENVVDLRSNFIDSGWGTLTARIDSNQQAVCTLDALGIGRRTIVSSFKFDKLKSINLKIGIFVDDRTQIRDKSVLSLGSIDKILPEWGGVQIKYQGVRVYPYGDDDWLDIDRDRGLRRGRPEKDELFEFAQALNGVEPSRSLLNLLSMRNYVGTVEIEDTAEGFEPKLNREGFISSPSLDQLKDFVRFAIDWSTILRDYYIREESIKSALISREVFEAVIGEKVEQTRVIESALEHLKQEVRIISSKLPSEDRKHFEIAFESATDVIRKQHSANKVELTHLRLIASTSTLLLIFSHEVKSLLGVLETNKNTLDSLVGELPIEHRNKVKNISSEFTELKNRLSELLSLTSLVGGSKRETKIGKVALRDRIERVEKVFELIVNKYNIKVDYSEIPYNLVLKNILEAEVYSILLNVMSNSIKSVIAGGKNRKIRLRADRKDNMNLIYVEDTGIGINPSRFEEVFIPFISDPDGELYENLDRRLNPEDSMIVGSGSGLGLGIVKEIIVNNNGSIQFLSPEEGWKSKLEIRLQ